MNSSSTYKKKYYENNKILLFPEKPRELQIIEKIPCQYCGRFLTAIELKQDKKVDIILIIAVEIQIIYTKVENQGISKKK